VEGVGSNKIYHCPCKRGRKVPPQWQKVVGHSLLPLLTSAKRTFGNASPLDAGILAAKNSMFDIVDLIILQEREPHISRQALMRARLESYLYP
jgi:hypothetical protein